jgi:UDP-N-acetylmuramyl tripeptide synthase
VPAALLEVAVATPGQCAAWETRVRAMCARLGWPAPRVAIRPSANDTSLAFTAPVDQLLVATEVGEWAWQAACVDEAGGHPPLPFAPPAPSAWDRDLAFATLRCLALAEARPREIALRAAAAAQGIACLVDDDALSLGEGRGSLTWPLDGLPAPDDVPWDTVHDVPVALVTGSNGKTTTVRLVAAMLQATGLRAGFNCTDGVFVDGQAVEHGDWSGPAGARAVLRDVRVDAGVLEAARGGLLRRGLAVARADAALVTNVSADHFGEYGIDDLDALADAKLVVARAIDARGRLVLNADDEVLVRRADSLEVPRAWFAADDAHPRLVAARERGEPTCAASDGRLRLTGRDGDIHDLGALAAMPLTIDGTAPYNAANLTGAALLALCLGVAPTAIAGVCGRFGAARGDNPGRLERWRIVGAEVLVDYAHNPEGLAGLLGVAQRLRAPQGRLLLLLGQAGNREDDAIAELAAVAAAARPSRVVLKDIAGYMRGRGEGDVATLLAAALTGAGVDASAISVVLDEAEASRVLVEEARAGDVVVLPVHNLQARASIAAWLDARAARTPGASAPD